MSTWERLRLSGAPIQKRPAGERPLSDGWRDPQPERCAGGFALKQDRKSMTLVHKSSSMRFGEGAFRNWGYGALHREFGGKTVVWGDCGSDPPPGQSLVENNFVDITLRQVLTHPQGSYDFHRQKEGGSLLKKYSEFAFTIIDNMN